MEYPKIITLENEKLSKLLAEKSELVTTGRAMSEEIEKLEAEMHQIDDEMKKIEKTVDISSFKAREQEITSKVEVAIKEMEQIQSEIKELMVAAIPAELGSKYATLKEEKDKKENERNKIALKVQKYNDKIIPQGRKLMKPYLEDNYDDYDTISLKDGKIVASIFNHVEDFKANFKKK